MDNNWMFNTGEVGQESAQEFGTGTAVASGKKARKMKTPSSGKFGAVRDELKTGAVLMLICHGVQATLFLLMIYLFSTHHLILPILLTSVGILVAFVTVDRRFAPTTGKDQTAFRVAAGYSWLMIAFLCSLVGLIGGKIFSCTGKKNCTTDYMFDMLKTYAVIAIIQGILLAGLAAIIIIVKKRKAIEARKTTSIRISKPKMLGS